MNWQRIKLILVLALVAANVFIVYFIVLKQSENVTPTAKEQQALMASLMAKRRIENVAENIPIQIDMPKVTISYESIDLNAIAKDFFDGEYYSKGGTYYAQDYTFRLVNNGSILYVSRTTPIKKVPPITYNMAQNTAEKFITESLGFDKDYYFKSYTDLGDTIRLDYIQRHEDYFIDNTYMRVIIDGAGIVSVERRWLEVSFVENGTLNLISYDAALFKALDAIEQKNYKTPLQIKAIKLGYGLENTVLGTDIKSGEAMPYYRFYLSNDNDITIPALKIN